MNIWCISKYASIPRYGAGARLFFLAKEFKKKCHQVLLITSDSNHLCDYPKSSNRYNEDKIDGVDICWISNIKYKKTASFKRVLSWFDFELRLALFRSDRYLRPDVVIVSSLSLFSILYGYYLKKRYRATLVFEIRDIWPLTLTEEGGISKYHPFSILLGWLEKFGYNKADLIVGTMPRLDLHVESILGRKKRVFCSPLGLDVDELKDIVHVPKLDHFFPKGKRIVGYAGSMGISNSLQSFIDYIKKVEIDDSLHFVLVGSGDLKESFQMQLKGCSNVTFVPKIKQHEVQYFLSKCDILYLSTQDSKVWEFGQSMNKVVQYMLAGKPVIASYSGYPSMLNEAGSGAFIKGNDSEELANVLSYYISLSENELKQIGERGKDWIIQNRMYEHLAEQYLQKILEVRESCNRVRGEL